MSAPAFFTTLSMILGTVLIIFGMRYRASVLQTRTRLAEDQAWRQAAETTASALTRIQADLADARSRLEAIEKILKEVG